MSFLSPIISILIPTYNRAHILQECLERLLKISITHKANIEIIISDNASTDDTKQVVSKYKNKFVNHSRFIYHRNSYNQGAAKNLISLYKLAAGDYIMFIGDDDFISEKNFPSVLSILLDGRRPSAIIQSRWLETQRVSKTGFVSYEYATKLFYEYGNAYGGIVDRRAALKILDNNKIFEEIQKIVWPQTVIGFLAIYQLKDRPIYITDFEIGGNIFPQNITNKAYWVRSLHDLLGASFLIDEFIGINWTKKMFVSIRTLGFMSHIKSIIYYGLISENSDSSSVQRELKKHFGWPGYFWSMILLLSDRYPKLYLWSGILFNSIIRFESPASIYKKYTNAKIKYKDRLLSAKKNVRYGDWF